MKMGDKESKSMGICKIDARNRITLPKKVLTKLNIATGDYVSIEENNAVFCIHKAYFSVRRNKENNLII